MIKSNIKDVVADETSALGLSGKQKFKITKITAHISTMNHIYQVKIFVHNI